jgi:hypothetical protein
VLRRVPGDACTCRRRTTCLEDCRVVRERTS